MLSRDERWWKEHRLADPESWRRGASKKFYAAVEVDGAGRGLRVLPRQGRVAGRLRRRAKCASSRRSRRRRLRRGRSGASCTGSTSFVPRRRSDLRSRLAAAAARPRSAALGLRVGDGLWLRLVDLDAALQARSYRPARVRRARSDATSSAPGTPAATASATTPGAPRTPPTSRSTSPTLPLPIWARSTSTASHAPASSTSVSRGPSRRRRCSSAPTCRPYWPEVF